MLVEAETVLSQVHLRAEEVRCPGSRVEGVRRILVVRDDRLGDVVVTLPAIRALRRAYPLAWIGMLARAQGAAVGRMAEDVDEIVLDTGDPRRAAASMQAFRPDMTLLVSRSLPAAWAACRLKLPHRVGSGRRAYSALFHRRVHERRRAAGRHEVEYALSFAHRVGAEPGPAEFALAVPREFEESCVHWLEMHGVEPPFVVLHPGSGGSCPSWSVAHFVQLAVLLEGHGVRVVFTLGPADDAIQAALDREPRPIRRLPRYCGPVAAVAALLARARVVIGASTGPVHLASALGTRTLALHAPWATCGVARWGPYSSNGWALVADLAGAERWSRRKRRRLGGRLLDAVSPATVHACVRDLIEGRAPELRGGDRPSGPAPDHPVQARNSS